MDKTNEITAYDIIHDTLLLEEELYNYRNKYDFRELVDGDDGYVRFIEKRIEEFEKLCEEYYAVQTCWGTHDSMEDFVENNIDKWVRKLKGNNLYKVKVVLEFDVESADKLDTVVSNVKELFYDKSVEDYGCDAIKDVRVVNAVGKEVDE